NHYFNQGYFNTQVLIELDSLQTKKVKSLYKIITGTPYASDSTSIVVRYPELDSLYTTNRRTSNIKKNDKYNSNKLNKERDRITSFFRNDGSYDFQKTYINYELDTLNNNHTADILLNIENKNIKEGDTLRTEPFKLYKVSQVNVFTSNTSSDASVITDSVQ